MKFVHPEKENQVLELLKAGKKCREISAILHVSGAFTTTIRQKHNLPKGKRCAPKKPNKKPAPQGKNAMNTKSEYGDAF